MRLEGKSAIVTGGASGIGEATAQMFADEGAKVVVADVAVEKGQAVADAIGGTFVETDMTDAAQVEALVAKTVEMHGTLDILFNNAGIDGVQAPLADTTLDNWHSVIKLNLDGAFFGMKYALAQMEKQGSGVIVNSASVTSFIGYPNLPAYVSSKTGLAGLIRAATVDYAPKGIRINGIGPSAVYTPLVEHFIQSSGDPDATRTHLDNLNPYPGMVSLHCVAATVTFLASDDAEFINGVVIPIDGGYTAL